VNGNRFSEYVQICLDNFLERKKNLAAVINVLFHFPNVQIDSDVLRTIWARDMEYSMGIDCKLPYKLNLNIV
jgi:hypothetical protein